MLLVAAIAVSTALGTNRVVLSDGVPLTPVAVAVFLVVILVIGPIPEEMGWRGYWLDVLCRHMSPLAASGVVGVTWAAWHVPLSSIDGYPLQTLVADPWQLVAYFGDLVPKSVVYTWLYFARSVAETRVPVLVLRAQPWPLSA